MSRKEAVRTYRSLEEEQDLHSPHYYFFDGLTLSENSVVADIGVAEGNFGLKIVDRVKELYLFECDAGWIEALEATLSPGRIKCILSIVSFRIRLRPIQSDWTIFSEIKVFPTS